MKRSRKRLIPNILIGFGIILLLIFCAYESANYPWVLLLSEVGLIDLPEDLPDPSPLPESVLSDGLQILDPDLSDMDTLPDQPGWFTTRPVMSITQLGIIKLPKIQVSENVVEGSGDELFYGVGHVPGTAMPGQEGNCVLSGHRNYVIMHPFRHLDKLAEGDKVYLINDEYTYTYEVFKIFITGPDDTWVLYAQEEEKNLLTLLTCTPVLNPVNRLIVWCRLTDTSSIE